MLLAPLLDRHKCHLRRGRRQWVKGHLEDIFPLVRAVCKVGESASERVSSFIALNTSGAMS